MTNNDENLTPHFKTSVSNQMSFLTLDDSHDIIGCYNIDDQLRNWISRAIIKKKLSRIEVAEKLTNYLGIKITEHMINQWTANGQESKRHRLPAMIIPVLCLILEDLTGLEIMAQLIRCKVINQKDTLFLDIAKLENERDEVENKLKNRRALLKEFDK